MVLVVFDDALGRHPVLVNYDHQGSEWYVDVWEMSPGGDRHTTSSRVLVNALDGVQGDLHWVIDRLRKMVPPGPPPLAPDQEGLGNA